MTCHRPSNRYDDVTRQVYFLTGNGESIFDELLTPYVYTMYSFHIVQHKFLKSLAALVIVNSI